MFSERPHLRWSMTFRLLIMCCFLAWGVAGRLPSSPGQDLGFGGLGAEKPVTLSAEFEVYEDGRGGRVHVTARIAPGWHVYSVTQKEGALPTVIQLGKTDSVKLTGPFVPDRPPQLKTEGLSGETHVVEIHEDQVTWTAPFELTRAVEDPESLKIPLSVEGQVCLTQCQLFGEDLEATFAGTIARPSDQGEYRPERSHGKFRGEVTVRSTGERVELVWTLTAVPDPKWHIYAAGVKKKGQTSCPTQFYFQLPEGWTAGEPQASSPPVEEEVGLPGEKTVWYHREPVTWTVELAGPRASLSEQPVLQAWVGYQFCWENGCDADRVMAVTADLSGALSKDVDEHGVKLPLSFEPAEMSYDKLTERIRANAARRTGAVVSGQITEYPLWLVLLIAVLGGFLLNFMPCVLPVIGLKIMAFVEQAGASRRKVFMLNFWYAVGMLIVFLAFALLLSARQLGLRDDDFGWGQQSQYPPYVITMTAVIFVMALSYLGVWEIPVPGFVGTSKLAQYSERGEGYLAASLKGVITTLVAIPCTAPALGTALAYCYSQPPKVIFTVFVAMWFGMAFPYLVIGIFPRLISFLPRPGMWMETFKEFLGFLLLGTVVFFLSFLEDSLVVPTVGFLIALWMACWIIGKIPLTAPTGLKTFLRSLALVVALLGGYFAYGFRGENSYELAWEPFSPPVLESKLKEGNIVLVDFTADW